MWIQMADLIRTFATFCFVISTLMEGEVYYRPQRSCEGYVFTGVCLSTEGVLSQHALQVVFQHSLQQVSGGGVPAPGGRGLLQGGLETPPGSRQLLLRTVLVGIGGR